MKLIIKVLLALSLVGIFIWYFAQYLRTGQLSSYVYPPSFKDVPKHRVILIGQFISYSSVEQIKSSANIESNNLALLTSKDEAFRGITFSTKTYSLKGLKISNDIFNAEMLFYNDRLASVLLCTSQNADYLFDFIYRERNIAINRGQPYGDDVLSVSYEWNRSDCARFSDKSLVAESNLWDNLYN